MENSLKISFGYYFVNLRAIGSNFWLCRFQVYIFQTNTVLDFLYPFVSFSVETDEQTDGWTLVKSLACWSSMYIHNHTYLDSFSYFTPLYSKHIFFHIWKYVGIVKKYKNRIIWAVTNIGLGDIFIPS